MSARTSHHYHCIHFGRPQFAKYWVAFLFLIQFSAFGNAETPRKIIILSQTESGSNAYLKKAYEAQGHEVVIGLLDRSTQVDEKSGSIVIRDNRYALSDFDLAYFRTWGNANARNTAHTWQAVFEQLGIPCIDPLQAKLYNNNKHTMMRLFQENDVPMPKTLVVDVGTSIEACIEMIQAHFKDMVVIKGEGSGGKNVRFVRIEEERRLCEVLRTHHTTQGAVGPTPLVLQQYVDSKNTAGFSFHYRILVVGEEVVAVRRHTASNTTTYASNVALGGKKETIAAGEALSADHQAAIKKACRLLGTDIAGVDATVLNGQLYIFEVNDSPGLTPPTASTAPLDYIEKMVTYSIQHLARKR
ncbi:MAG: ATP-grasp domain-containing protein [Roseivirga sp.]